MSIALLDRSNNLHLYWGEKIRTVEVHGPVTAAAAAYTPLLRCRAVTATGGDSDLHERATPKAQFHA